MKNKVTATVQNTISRVKKTGLALWSLQTKKKTKKNRNVVGTLKFIFPTSISI